MKQKQNKNENKNDYSTCIFLTILITILIIGAIIEYNNNTLHESQNEVLLNVQDNLNDRLECIEYKEKIDYEIIYNESSSLCDKIDEVPFWEYIFNKCEDCDMDYYNDYKKSYEINKYSYIYEFYCDTHTTYSNDYNNCVINQEKLCNKLSVKEIKIQECAKSQIIVYGKFNLIGK